jgi:hypothetical protein
VKKYLLVDKLSFFFPSDNEPRDVLREFTNKIIPMDYCFYKQPNTMCLKASSKHSICSVSSFCETLLMRLNFSIFLIHFSHFREIRVNNFIGDLNENIFND